MFQTWLLKNHANITKKLSFQLHLNKKDTFLIIMYLILKKIEKTIVRSVPKRIF